jgi:hypothetical protein
MTPSTPPPSAEEKTLGQIAANVWLEQTRAPASSAPDWWQAVGEAIASHVSAPRIAALGELEKSLAHHTKPFSVQMLHGPSGLDFDKIDCEVVDVGHADRIIIIEAPREIVAEIVRLNSLVEEARGALESCKVIDNGPSFPSWRTWDSGKVEAVLSKLSPKAQDAK